jgi:hypothetical protein
MKIEQPNLNQQDAQAPEPSEIVFEKWHFKI